MNIKKNLRRFSLVFSLLLLVTLPHTSMAAEYVTVKAETANIRTGPGKANPVSMELFRGYPLEVIGKKGDWSKIRDFENDTGWIFTSLTAPLHTVIVSSKGKINMRSAPSTKQKNIVANLERGVILELVERKGKWFKVRHESGIDGWVYKPLVWPN